MCDAGGALFGTAASGAASATSGLFGTAGDFALGNTLSTLGTGAKIFGAITAAKDKSDFSTKEAELRQRQGDFDLKRSKDDARRLKGRQIVSSAKSGVKQSGSVLEIMRESAEIAEQDALEIELGTKTGVASRMFEGKQAKKAGKISAASTLLTSFGGKL
jgi:hypothetical protein